MPQAADKFPITKKRKVYISLDRSFVHKQTEIQLETVPLFYMVIRAMRRASRLQCKGVPSFPSYFKTLGIEYRSDDVIKMKFVKLWDLLSYSERTTSKTPTRQKLAIRGKLSLRY